MDSVKIILRTSYDGKQFVSKESEKYGVDVVFSETDGLVGNAQIYEAIIVFTPALVSIVNCFVKALFSYLSSKNQVDTQVEIIYKDVHLKNVKAEDVPRILAALKNWDEGTEEKATDGEA